MTAPHRDTGSDAPGRIPESLIDAAIDGELDPRMSREIAHALRYDPRRSSELRDTADAINALQMPVPVPDFTHAILDRTDRHRRFIPRSWRRQVRMGRLGVAACLLLMLVGIAGLQRLYPRLTTLGTHPTPVRDIEIAVEQDRRQLATVVTHEVKAIKNSVEPMAGLFRSPGRDNFHYGVTVSSAGLASSSSLSGSDGQSPLSMTRAHPGLAAVYMLSPTHDFASDPHRPMGLIVVGGRGFALAGWPIASGPDWHRSDGDRSSAETIELDVPDLP